MTHKLGNLSQRTFREIGIDVLQLIEEVQICRNETVGHFTHGIHWSMVRIPAKMKNNYPHIIEHFILPAEERTMRIALYHISLPSFQCVSENRDEDECQDTADEDECQEAGIVIWDGSKQGALDDRVDSS